MHRLWPDATLAQSGGWVDDFAATPSGAARSSGTSSPGHECWTCSASRIPLNPTRAPLQMHWQPPERVGSKGALEWGSASLSASCGGDVQCEQQFLTAPQQASLDGQRPARQRSGQVTIAPISRIFKIVRIIENNLWCALYLSGSRLANLFQTPCIQVGSGFRLSIGGKSHPSLQRRRAGPSPRTLKTACRILRFKRTDFHYDWHLEA